MSDNFTLLFIKKWMRTYALRDLELFFYWNDGGHFENDD